MVLLCRLELAAADGGEVVIDKEAPEFGRGLSVGPDGGDEKVVKVGGEGAVEWEMGDFGGGVEGGGWGVARFWVCVEVGAVTLVASA